MYATISKRKQFSNCQNTFQRETCIVTEPGQYVYTERAILEVKIQNEEQEKKLTDWSYKSRMGSFKMWEGVENSFHIPSLYWTNVDG